MDAYRGLWVQELCNQHARGQRGGICFRVWGLGISDQGLGFGIRVWDDCCGKPTGVSQSHDRVHLKYCRIISGLVNIAVQPALVVLRR